MRIVVHDFGAYAFPAELSRELAGRGHDVLHLYCASFPSPNGAVSAAPADPSTLRIEGLSIGREFERYAPRQRMLDELSYGRVVAARTASFGPDVVLSSNAPLLSQRSLLRQARRARSRFVYWWQDSYGVGVGKVARRRSPILGPIIAWPFERLERRLLARSDRVVAISEGLRSHALRWGIEPDKVDVIPNWAPVSAVVPGPSENSWKAAHGHSGVALVLYAGTLGLKHDPELLAALAVEGQVAGFDVAVVSEGLGREFLERRRADLRLHNLLLLDYQPSDLLPELLAAADVLVVILEADAGAFSVPSKILTYLCAGRPIVAALPPDNQAASVLKAAGAGLTVPPADPLGLRAAVTGLLSDPERCKTLGANGRRYATQNFDRATIADRFECLLGAAAKLEVGIAS